MNKKILTIAITCFSCFLLISNLAVADKPESVKQKQAEHKAEHKAEKAKEIIAQLEKLT